MIEVVDSVGQVSFLGLYCLLYFVSVTCLSLFLLCILSSIVLQQDYEAAKSRLHQLAGKETAIDRRYGLNYVCDSASILVFDVKFVSCTFFLSLVFVIVRVEKKAAALREEAITETGG